MKTSNNHGIESQASEDSRHETERPAIRRTGRIAKMPAAIRAWVNESLADGFTYKKVSEGLAERGFPGVSTCFVHRWFIGGHQDWLRNEERKENLRIRTKAAFALVQDFKDKDKSAFSSCNELLLLSQINDVLQGFNPERLKELIEEKPEHFFRLASAINAQSSERIKREKLELEWKKYQDQVAEQKRKIDEALEGSQCQGLTPETLAKIEEAARLL